MRTLNTNVVGNDGLWFIVINGALNVSSDNPNDNPVWIAVNDEDFDSDSELDQTMNLLASLLKTQFSIFTWGPDWHPDWSPADLAAYQARLTRWYYN
jgi:hypothetical protein